MALGSMGFTPYYPKRISLAATIFRIKGALPFCLLSDLK